ncbi:Nramp family divalent metal transporter (plasmid) [Polymorphobacter sp. PAMC 29334]|uniref:Nramp family divalent metal transporter n=1 Tax=Polymorphobacter sp. PAMC 29334 TaxID=2862331 RepID=UPI001C755281|nr:Nramp family divalent metal transporter [Polymorphobacter sp. PAMC 29334]QYE33475.1 Nramp family divalent metal transporter [Polymorphobacter sp. PAMC 29334]
MQAPHSAFAALAQGSISVPGNAPWWRRFFAFIGPGYLIAVGYMDPGNWATDIGGGSAFGYMLLSVVLAASVMAMLLQALSVRLGVAARLDLAQACRAFYPRPVSIGLWILCEIAIVACDLAEVLGTAIALQLLFHLPLLWGVIVTAFDVFLILALQRFGFRKLEAVIIALLMVIAGCFAFELAIAGPNWMQAAVGLVPSQQIITDPKALYLAIGILGATVMPHNLYLHSALVQTRTIADDDHAKAQAIGLATLDSTIALFFAFFINAAILMLAAATFHRAGRTEIADISQASDLLTPLLGVGVASTVFAVALLASGQNSTVTGTLAGQIVMEGFLDLRLPVWLRRLVTRLLAVVPAAIIVAAKGDRGATELLILSQVILSLQLPFAVVPLVSFTNRREVMGRFANPRWLACAAWVATGLIVVLNAALLWNLVYH